MSSNDSMCILYKKKMKSTIISEVSFAIANPFSLIVFSANGKPGKGFAVLTYFMVSIVIIIFTCVLNLEF